MSYPRVTGLYGISAQVIAYSMSPDGIRLITFELTYPRIILAELNTHRMLSKNSASSRAIPFEKMLQQLEGRPVRFGEANPGMQDKGTDFETMVDCDEVPYLKNWSGPPWLVWKLAKQAAVWFSHALYKAGLHKQVYNRLTEPFQMMKTVVSATDWNNFFWLRNHGAADPTLQELARVMWEAIPPGYEAQALQPGEWHLPYVHTVRDDTGTLRYWLETETEGVWQYLLLEDAKAVSAARTAAVSFRNIDYGLKKCLEVYQRLIGDDRKHASAFEHQGTPMAYPSLGSDDDNESSVNLWLAPESWEPGVSHMTRNRELWSGNFRGWVQLRKLIPGECKEG